MQGALTASDVALLASSSTEWWWRMNEALRFTYVSDRFTNTFGFAATALVGRSPDDFAGASLAAALRTRAAFRDVEIVIADAKGEPRPVALSGSPVLGRDGRFAGYIGVGRDLGELRALQRQNLEQTTLFAAVLENIDEGIFLVRADLRIATFNLRALELLGLAPHELKAGDLLEDVFRQMAHAGEYGDVDPETAVAESLGQLRSRKRVSVERQRANGHTLSQVVTPLVGGGFLFAIVDVTERAQRDGRPSAASAPAPRSGHAVLQRGSERILVVEDDEAVRHVVAGQLRKLGYDIVTAESGADGLATLKADAGFDLLLTDVVMPWPLSGKGLADEVARRWPTIPVLYMSGFTENAIVNHGLLDPDVRLLQKPFTLAQLAATVRDVLDGID